MGATMRRAASWSSKPIALRPFNIEMTAANIASPPRFQERNAPYPSIAQTADGTLLLSHTELGRPLNEVASDQRPCVFKTPPPTPTTNLRALPEDTLWPFAQGEKDLPPTANPSCAHLMRFPLFIKEMQTLMISNCFLEKSATKFSVDYRKDMGPID